MESDANVAGSDSEIPATIQSSHEHSRACSRTKLNRDSPSLSSPADTNYSAAMGLSTASGNYSTAMGNSTANSDYSTAMGSSTASGVSSTALGNAIASGDFSMAMGLSTASGNNSTAMGFSTAGGNNSFAAGNRAFADQPGSFIWCDSLAQEGHSQGTNTFTARASGGYYLFSSGGNTGVYLAAGGGSWASLSDRTSKENLVPVNPREVLDKVAALPVATWNYKSQEKSVRHLGPMAQDFAAAFHIGEDDRHITSVDEEGVALAAIQGLNQKVEEQQAENAELKRKNESLEMRLEALEKIIRNQKSN